MAQAYHRQSITVLQQQQLASQHQQLRLLSGTTPQPDSQQISSISAGPGNPEDTVEGALLMLAVQVAQSTAGAHLLLDQGISDLLPQVAKWLLSPAGGGMLCASVCIQTK